PGARRGPPIRRRPYGERLAEKMSETLFVSPNTRLLDDESNTKNEDEGTLGLPLNRKLEPNAKPFGCDAPWMRMVWLVLRSRTKTSSEPFVSPATRLVAEDVKATTLPLKLIGFEALRPLARP